MDWREEEDWKDAGKVAGKSDKFMQDVIEARRKMINKSGCSDEGEKSMIDVLLSLQEHEPEYYKDQIIRGMVQVHCLNYTLCIHYLYFN